MTKVNYWSAIVEILTEEFSESGVEDTEENYVAFIRQFEVKHGITIEGILNRGCWNTIGYNFKHGEDAVIFKLKYAL